LYLAAHLKQIRPFPQEGIASFLYGIRLKTKELREMNSSKHFIAVLCAAGAAFAVSAEEGKQVSLLERQEGPEGVAEKKGDAPEFEASLDFCSRQITYGIPDNSEPIATLSGEVSWHGFSFEGNAIYDLTKWGEKHGGYGNRKFKYQEINFGPGYEYTMGDPLPTPLTLSAKYTYEWHPAADKTRWGDGADPNPDTQFIYLCAGLNELWLKPTVKAEFDIDNEVGAIYLYPTIGHDWLLAGTGDSPDLEFGVELGLGIGNAKRNRLDADHDEWGFKDVNGTAMLTYHVTGWLSVSPYFQVSEEVTGWMRDAAEEADKDGGSLYYIGGCTVAAAF
jgi:hypothetical protein